MKSKVNIHNKKSKKRKRNVFQKNQKIIKMKKLNRIIVKASQKARIKSKWFQ